MSFSKVSPIKIISSLPVSGVPEFDCNFVSKLQFFTPKPCFQAVCEIYHYLK